MFNKLREEEGGSGQFGIVLFNSSQQVKPSEQLKSERETQNENETNTKSLLAVIGCTAQVTKFDPLPDGRIMTNNVGKFRFRILRIINEKPYITAKVKRISDDVPSHNLFPQIEDVWNALQDVLTLSNKLYDKGLDLSADIKRLDPNAENSQIFVAKDNDEQVPKGWPAPDRAEEFSFAICQVLDMPLAEQQILLQLTDTSARLKRQLNMLTTARNYLAAQVTIKNAGLKGF